MTKISAAFGVVGLLMLSMAACGGGNKAANGQASSTTQALDSTTAAIAATTAVPTTVKTPATPAAQQMGSILVAPPGFLPSTSTDVTNGPVGPADLDKMAGQTGAAAIFGFLGGYDETYDMTNGSDYVEVFLGQFSTSAQAAAFEQVLLSARSTSGAAKSSFGAIPGAVALNDTKAAADGSYEHDIAATKGGRLMAVSYTASTSVQVPQLSSMAVKQYARL